MSELICDECEHPIRLHRKDGCEVERGDALRDEILVAQGPCGCHVVEVITVEGVDYLTTRPEDK